MTLSRCQQLAMMHVSGRTSRGCEQVAARPAERNPSGQRGAITDGADGNRIEAPRHLAGLFLSNPKRWQGKKDAQNSCLDRPLLRPLRGPGGRLGGPSNTPARRRKAIIKRS